MGDSSNLEIHLYNNNPNKFIDRYGNPLPSNRDQDGVVKIVPTPVPVVDQVCDSLEPADCNPADVPTFAAVDIDINGSNFDCANYTVTISGACSPFGGAETSCTGTQIVWNFASFAAGCCNVSVTNNTTGMTSNICVGCLCGE